MSDRGRRGLPLRVRLTLASVLALAVILAALGVFLFARLNAELISAVDLGLRSRADAIAAGLGQPGQTLADAPDTGEVTVAQILSPSASVVETSGPTVPLLTAAALGTINTPTYLQRTWITSLNFKKEPNGSKWDPTPCSAK